MRSFKINKCPYDDRDKLYCKSSIDIEPGLTVLVGCNGTGKTTLLSTIQDDLESLDIPYFYYSDYTDGGQNSMASMLYAQDDVAKLATYATSSEGEHMAMNFGDQATKIGRYVRDNTDQSELWILLDAIDSGLSIDNIVEYKYLFDMILKVCSGKGQSVYIIVAANTYEMCRGTKCLDIYHGKYLDEFTDYESYRDFILKSSIIKSKRFK